MGSLAGEYPSEREEKGSERNGEGVPDLLEEAWFFRKLIDGSGGNKPAAAGGRFMGRCFSDPTSSQSVVPPAPAKGGGGLARAPSLPPCIGRRAATSSGRRNSSKSSKTGEGKEKQGSKIKPSGGGGGRNPGSLARAPSLPPWIGREEVEEEEEEEEEEESDGEENGMSMSRLIQQAMSSSLDDISPRHSVSSPKSMIRSCRSMRSEVRSGGGGGRRSPEVRDDQRAISRVISTTNHNNNPPPSTINPKGVRKLTKTMSNLEIQHDQASYYESKKKAAAGRPQRPSYDHLLRCGGPPIPTWAPGPTSTAQTVTATASSAEDIKAHLKVWARTVAANMH